MKNYIKKVLKIDGNKSSITNSEVSSVSNEKNEIAKANGYLDWNDYERVLMYNLSHEINHPTPKIVFKSLTRKYFMPYIFSAKFRGSSGINDLIVGDSGCGKTQIAKNIIVNNLSAKNPVRTSAVDLFSEYSHLCGIINERAKSQVSINMDFKNYHINIFDTYLGFDNYIYGQKLCIINLLFELFHPEDVKHLIYNQSFLNNALDDFYQEYQKDYEPGICSDIDELIMSFVVVSTKKTWKNVSNALLANGLEKEAIKANLLSSPTLSDFKEFLSQRIDDYTKEILDLEVSLTVVKHIENLLLLYPEMNERTNWNISSYNFINYDLSTFFKSDKKLYQNFIVNYVLLFNKLFFIKASFHFVDINEGLNAKINSDIDDLCLGEDWKSYIGHLSLEKMLYTYRRFTYFRKSEFKQTILDNFDAFKDNDLIKNFLREARMENVGYVFVANKDIGEDFLAYITGYLIHSSAFKENMNFSLGGFCTYPERSYINAWCVFEKYNQSHNLLTVPDMWRPVINLDF